MKGLFTKFPKIFYAHIARKIFQFHSRIFIRIMCKIWGHLKAG